MGPLEWLKWRIWWLLRQKYIVGVFIAAIKDGQILIVKKRLGVSTGWKIPGGGKSVNKSVAEQAKEELYQETSLVSNNLYLAYVSANESHRDLHVLFLTTDFSGTPKVIDTLEISEAKFVPVSEMGVYLDDLDHFMLACRAVALKSDLDKITANK